jgi:alanyl-tRNA synthetase
MKANEIRQRFLDFFSDRGHRVVRSSSLVPQNDPTLLFTNAGMVQFKKVFLGSDQREYNRAVTSQKCVRAGGKHNDLEEVGRTARHHTFFEMLGNFSFGDYFKREAIDYAWTFLTGDLGLEAERMFATVHHTDEEAAGLWKDVVGLPPDRIYRLGDKDNFWQMADTGPCGPCSELHYDTRPSSEREEELSVEEFEALGEAGVFLELWNLVFMQFDRDAEGNLDPLPAPSIDTGAGLERIASVLQGVSSNYHTDLFLPLLDRVGAVVGRPYEAGGAEGTSYRVLADHARAVAFLLGDGVFPSNEGRGYVLRRILRRAVRHAWILGRREPTLVEVVDEVVGIMSDAFPELPARKDHILNTTRGEEERFLTTIEGGMARFQELTTQTGGDGDEVAERDGSGGVIPGAEAFRLYDTFGFPLDLTELMAEEEGFTVDVDGFETALEAQRERSRADRARSGPSVAEDEGLEGWTVFSDEEQTFVGYGERAVETEVLAMDTRGQQTGLILKANPFYLEAGGQVSDSGRVQGDGWVMEVEDVRRVQNRTAVFGSVSNGFLPADPDHALEVKAQVLEGPRHDTERNHTATHLLHAALRHVLGEHVVQRGSLVAPDRLRFDFAHTAPMSPEERDRVEAMVNQEIWTDHPVRIDTISYPRAIERGAMALFGEKYGDEVRVVEVPGVSLELCGGTHCRHTGEIGLFKIVTETGVAAGVRRVEAVTGPGAFRVFQDAEDRLIEISEVLKAPPEAAPRRVVQLMDEKEEVETLLSELRKGPVGGGDEDVAREILESPWGPVEYRGLRLRARNPEDARDWGDGYREGGKGRVAVVAAEFPGGKYTLFSFVSDDLISQGVRADVIVRAVAEKVGGKGGGRPHLAQAGVEDPSALDQALATGSEVLRELIRSGSKSPQEPHAQG